MLNLLSVVFGEKARYRLLSSAEAASGSRLYPDRASRCQLVNRTARDIIIIENRRPGWARGGCRMGTPVLRRKKMKTRLGRLSLLLCCSAPIADDAVFQLSKHLGKTPALVVLVCGADEGDLPTLAGLVEETPWTVFCRGTASAGLDRIRDWASEEGLLGTRVCVAHGEGPSLWLAGDMADAVWVAPGVDDPPSEEEILRVLRPGGVCVASGRVVVKPAQPGVDEWRHPYHGPDNNVVSQDRVARLP